MAIFVQGFSKPQVSVIPRVPKDCFRWQRESNFVEMSLRWANLDSRLHGNDGELEGQFALP